MLSGERGRRILLAVGASIGFHFVAALGIEYSMSAKAHVAPPMPVEISRRVVEGASVRRDSPMQTELPPSDNPLKDVEAGVPVTLPNTPPSTPQPRSQPPKTSLPVHRQQENRQQPVNPSNIGVPVGSTDDASSRPPSDNTSNDGSAQTQPTVSSNPAPPMKSGGSAAARRSRGPNRGPMPLSTEEPKVPASLAGPGVTNSVGVRVDIRADGTSTVSILRSSGSSAVDDIVLTALRHWKWDPAAENNNPVDSSQTFKYVFKIG